MPVADRKGAVAVKRVLRYAAAQETPCRSYRQTRLQPTDRADRTDPGDRADCARAGVTGRCGATRWPRLFTTARCRFANGLWTSVRARTIKWFRPRAAAERISRKAAAPPPRPARPSYAW